MTTEALSLDREYDLDNKIAAGWLLWCRERKTEYDLKREELIHSGGPCLSDVMPGSRSTTSDPTGRKGQKLGDLKRSSDWLELIEEVEKRLPPKLYVFLMLRREYRYARKWAVQVQWKFPQEMVKRFGGTPESVWVERGETFSRWWNQIVEYTVRTAAKRGLL